MPFLHHVAPHACPWLLIAAVLLACSDEGSSAEGSTDDGTDSGTGVATGDDGDGSGSGDGQTSGSDDGQTSGSDDGGSTGPILDLDPEVTRYETQPMVVDITFRFTRPATATLAVNADPGVHIASLTGTQPATEHTYRLRGLAPETPHEVDATLEDEGGGSEQTLVTFETHPPLPNFISSFEVTQNGEPSPEYRLFDRWRVETRGLFSIDPAGRTRWYLPTWSTSPPAWAVVAGVKLLDDGRIVYIQDHSVRIVDELGTMLLDLSRDDLAITGLHHDVIQLENGNFLALSFAFREIYYPDRGTTHDVAGDLIVEFTEAAELLWTWNSFDHLDPQRIRDGFDSNFPIINPVTQDVAKDWTHGNGIVHDPEDDSILLSLRHQDWIVKVDHETGDIVWRLGEEGDFTLTEGTWFFHQHSPEWQPDGSLLLYDNGNGNPHLPDAQELSRPVRYELDEVSWTAIQVWEETAEAYSSDAAGDADRLANGNILVVDSTVATAPGPYAPQFARLREVDPETNAWVWSVRLEDDTFVYRTVSYPRLPGEGAP